jgi:uncharacterized membrane protein YhaH (DUF805 family)
MKSLLAFNRDTGDHHVESMISMCRIERRGAVSFVNTGYKFRTPLWKFSIPNFLALMKIFLVRNFLFNSAAFGVSHLHPIYVTAVYSLYTSHFAITLTSKENLHSCIEIFQTFLFFIRV